MASILLAPEAFAQGFGYGRSGAEFFSQCPQVSPITGGPACVAKVCGHTVNWNNGNTISVADLGINNSTQYSNVANTLNALCGANAGDGLLASGGSLAVQNAQVESVGRAQGPAGKVGASGGAYGAGGVAELGSGTYGATIPLQYAYTLPSGAAFSSVGFVSFAHQGDANQGAVSGSPAYAWQVKNADGERIIGIAGYVPLSAAFASVSGIDGAQLSWGAGGGALAIGGTRFRAMHITYGGGGAVRMTNAGVAVPLSVLLRAEQPLGFLYNLLNGVATLSYGNDFLNPGSEYWVLGLGAAFGKYEFGYRGFYSGSYVAHALGFTIRKDLEGSELIEQIPPEEEKKPTGPTPPVGPNGPTILPAGPKFAPLPPPPEVPQLAPECTTDLDCPGDNVCEEARCLPPL